MKFKKILFIIICIPAITYSAGLDNLALLQGMQECLEPVIDCLKSVVQKDVLVGTFHNQTSKSIHVFATIACYYHTTQNNYSLNQNFRQIIEPGAIYTAYCKSNRLFDPLLQKEYYPETVIFKEEGTNQWIAFLDKKMPRNKHVVFKEAQP